MRDFQHLSPAAERILDVAETLIQRQGYNGFSYEDIAQAVGIRKPSVHHHFATKADLTTVVAQRYVERFTHSLESLERTQAKPHDRLVAYAQVFQEHYQDKRLCLCGMLGAESETLPASVRAQLQAFYELNLRWLASTLVQGWPSHASQADQMALLLFSALEGSMIVGRTLSLADAPLNVVHAFLNPLMN
jgi:TetR/AcrR family transcriptional repressor of nem operon